MSTSRPFDATAALAVAAIACLVAMVAITLASGVSQETFEIVRAPAVSAADLRAHGGAMRALFGIDSAFLVFYSVFFIGFARRLDRPEVRLYLRLGLGFVLATAVLDMVEDHHIMAMLLGAQGGDTPSAGEIALQHTLSQVKFHLSYLGLFLLGLAVPRDHLAGIALALVLTVGQTVSGAILFVAPASMLPAMNLNRWIGFVLGFALALLVLRRLPRRAAGDAAGSGAPA